MSTQVLDRVLLCYRMGDSAGHYPVRAGELRAYVEVSIVLVIPAILITTVLIVHILWNLAQRLAEAITTLVRLMKAMRWAPLQPLETEPRIGTQAADVQ